MDSLVDSVLPKIRQRIHATLSDHHLPGAAVAIVRDQELAWSEGFGLADITAKRPMDPNALFGVASINKTFTAAAIVQLRDEGKLSLDDPLANFIPEFKAVTCRYGRIEDVTLRRLLTHLSGLVGESPTPHWRSANFPSMEQILRELPHSALVIEPHSAFKYSNLGFALLGEVVARVSGRPFTEYLFHRGRLGSSRTSITNTEARIQASFLVGIQQAAPPRRRRVDKCAGPHGVGNHRIPGSRNAGAKVR